MRPHPLPPVPKLATDLQANGQGHLPVQCPGTLEKQSPGDRWGTDGKCKVFLMAITSWWHLCDSTVSLVGLWGTQSLSP
jgi:hypothetical protein